MSASRLERLQEKEEKDSKTVQDASSQMPLSELKKKLAEEEKVKMNYSFLALEDNVWYYRDRQSLPRGPCPLSSLRTAWINGIIDENTIVWGQGLEEWLPIRNVTALPALIRNMEVVVLTWAKRKMLDKQIAKHRAQRTQKLKTEPVIKSCCAPKTNESQAVTAPMACLSLALPVPQFRSQQ